MRTWRRAGAAVVLAAMVAVTGCGRDTGAGEEAAAPVAEGKASGDITVWAMGTEGEKLSVLAADFMRENPDAKVTVTPIPWDGAHDKLATAIAGKQTPDLSLIGTTWMGEFAKTGGLDPTPTDLIKKEDFFEGAWNTTVVDDTSYGVPWYVETRLFYVNSAVAARAGITTPPKTWEEFKSAIAALKSRGGAKWGVNLLPPGSAIGSWQSIMPFVWSNGGDVATGDRFTLDSPQAVEAYGFYKSFFDEGLAPKDLAQGALEPAFLAGEIGAFPSGPWHIGVLKEQGGAGKFQLWQMPGRQSATSFVGGGDLAVFSDAKNRDGAWKFVAYLSRPEVQTKWYQTVSDLPAVKKGWDDPALRGDPLLSTFGKQLEDAKSPPAIATWEQIAAAIDGEVEKMAKAGAKPADAAKAMQQRATSIGTGV
ncbi:sugar ABC transporter substrate-binding protein [Plantactinospora sp. KLBMP9567]|uniref:sugar ABC transporter substrate-binding protein n=1 Tax=Plantactinospora sp. KLBMP9567 TaxID=3085900 RepID=UPI0029812BA1|nr:sugar ABC transporter substrate-binding protein [Plantactinospora sp. KLBMP9567]MDW5326642.1 sugar ABC transporter substrate-binding protein [Plantactinospora sp. KLBMP9567]